MSNKNVQLDVFVKRVLGCMKEQRRSVKEVHEGYMKLYPPGFFRRQLSGDVSEYKVEVALRKLNSLGFLEREVTRFHNDISLKKDIAVYYLTNEGRLYLLPKKK